MTILSTNYSEALLSLFKNGRPPISAVETGPWFTIPQIEEAQRKLPQFDLHFHASSMLTNRFRLAPAIRRIQAYHACTKSPWVTPHIDLLPPGYFKMARSYKLLLPMPGPQRMIDRFIMRVQQLSQVMDIPIVLENMPSLPNGRFLFQSDPRRITHILEQTGCNMLLDTSHARVAASLHNIDIHDYLHQLPLDKVVHIHLSGPRERDGQLFDAHESLQEEDYKLLAWLLERTQPRLLTLEYFRDPTLLLEQLNRLAHLIR